MVYGSFGDARLKDVLLCLRWWRELGRVGYGTYFRTDYGTVRDAKLG